MLLKIPSLLPLQFIFSILIPIKTVLHHCRRLCAEFSQSSDFFQVRSVCITTNLLNESKSIIFVSIYYPITASRAARKGWNCWCHHCIRHDRSTNLVGHYTEGRRRLRWLECGRKRRWASGGFGSGCILPVLMVQ